MVDVMVWDGQSPTAIERQHDDIATRLQEKKTDDLRRLVKALAADAYRTAHETHRAMVKQVGASCIVCSRLLSCRMTHGCCSQWEPPSGAQVAHWRLDLGAYQSSHPVNAHFADRYSRIHMFLPM